jgi:hypothetical protein
VTRRVHLDGLREADPTTLEILVADAVRRPIVQIDASTLSDLVALAEVETLPKSLRSALKGFADRMPQEIADLPEGEPYDSFLAELDHVPPERVPRSIRAVLEIEADRKDRDARARERTRAVLARCAEAPPEDVTPGSGKPSITRLRTAAEDAPKATPKRPPTTGAVTRKAPVPRAKVIDVDRHAWLVENVLDRLGEYLEQGLREEVLIAGIKHRARANYPDLTHAEIGAVLRELASSGRVRSQAGRWRRIIGGW